MVLGLGRGGYGGKHGAGVEELSLPGRVRVSFCLVLFVIFRVSEHHITIISIHVISISLHTSFGVAV
jgi:hypothetical protein